MIYILAIDQETQEVLSEMLAAANVSFQVFADPEIFLTSYDASRPGCLIASIRRDNCPVMTGLQRIRNELGLKLPVIVVTREPDVANAVRSLRLGALDFLIAPVDPEELVSRAKDGLKIDSERIRNENAKTQVAGRFAALTERERELVPLIAFGYSNKQIAMKLNLSVKTVGNHRANILAKVDAVNTADFVRLATASGMFKLVSEEKTAS